MTLIITIDEGEEIFTHVDRISYRGGWSFEIVCNFLRNQKCHR